MEAGESDTTFFENRIRPLLVEHCFECHSQKSGKSKGGLRLDTRQGLLDGGDTGPAMVPGKPSESLLVKAVGYSDPDLEMPPKTRLSQRQVDDLATWIAAGAPWPKEDGPANTKAQVGAMGIDASKHWAWSPVRPVPPPQVRDGTWAKTPIDRFILARLEAEGLRPAPEADRHTLIRRAAFVLTGLPPLPEQVEAFVADTSNGAFERMIDAQLASPGFGEHWGRHWLDLVRYAETRGHEFDPRVPNAYQYRDYVIRAFNADLPYNRLVQEHIAGDLLAKPRLHPTEGFDESVLGTGFWYLGEMVHSPVDIRQDEAERIDNQIDVMGKTFLGLTIGCARCHDHKFDPISAKDFYALGGMVQSSSYRLARFDSDRHNRAVAERLWRLRGERDTTLRAALSDGLKDGIAGIERHLLASLELDGASGAGPVQVAAKHQLDLPRFTAWLTHLAAAADDVRDPFNAWGRLMRLPAAERQAGLAAIQRDAEHHQQRGREAWTKALTAVTVLVDYGKADEPWLPDGVSFGPKATVAGGLRFGADPAKAAMHVADRAAAWVDPLWRRLSLGPDSATDPLDLDMPRAGRTLRTRTIDLGEGPVHVLMRGKGMLYAAVAGHTIIDGPLHRALVRRVDSKNHHWRWERLDLSAYPAHRCHLEFTADSDDFAVAMVVQGPHPPPIPPAAAIATDATTIPAFAAAHRIRFAAALGGRSADGEQAALAAWLLDHPDLVGAADPARFAAFTQEQARIAGEIRERSRLAPAMMDGDGADWRILIRGSARNPGAVAPRALPASIFGKQPAITRGSGRLEMAQRLTDHKVNPFLARVMVNRLWHHLIGRGIVASVDNFGALGDKPTHPELLDHLATRFVAEGWSVKQLIRGIMATSTWRMSSAADPQQDGKDPANRWLHRAHLRRLPGESIRDALLAISGRLDGRMFGPSIPIHLSDFMQGRGRPKGGPLDGDGRRSIYQSVWRNFLPPMMLAFDTPIPFNTMGRRATSNVPAQALMLMNDPFVAQQAERWAERVVKAAPAPEAAITLMYRQAFARDPLPAETAAAREFLGATPTPTAWADLAHTLVMTQEFIFLQ
jgi:hypothetical protein